MRHQGQSLPSMIALLLAVLWICMSLNLHLAWFVIICMCCRSLKKTDVLEAVGFEVDAVKNVDSGDCMVRLTVYHRISGNVSVATIAVGTCSIASM